MIYITGDIHGANDINRLSNEKFPKGKFLTKEDYIIVCGDFGLVWNNSEEEKYWLNWLQDRKFTTLFIDGNHENFDLLKHYPVEYWNEGKVHIINESVIHLMRGQVFYLEGKTFFTLGGATSIDKDYRIENISWWKEEIPTAKEFEEGLRNLELNNQDVDYIISHSCSTKTLEIVSNLCGFRDSYKLDDINKYLDILESTIKYKHWYFAHYHKDVLDILPRQSLLYRKIVEI